MGTSVVVDKTNFQADVVQKSYEKPVLIDFFATWCGPCQMLKPLLEKLVQEYDFVLAKIDIDQNPELASAFRVEGVPDVRIVHEGRTREGFVGVLPEAKIRELLAELNLKSAFETDLDTLQALKSMGDDSQIAQQFADLLEQYPDNRDLAIEAAQFFISQDQLDQAESLLAPIQESEREHFSKAQAVRALIEFKRVVDDSPPETELDEWFVKGAQQALQGEYEGALENFLHIVGRDRQYRQDGARKAMLTIFSLLGDDHPLTKHYRKQLMLALY